MTKIISAGIPTTLNPGNADKADFSQLLKTTAGNKSAPAAKTAPSNRSTTTVITRKAFLLDELLSHAQNGKGLPTLDLGDLPERANAKADRAGTTAPEIVLINGDGEGMTNFMQERIDNLLFVHEDVFNDWATGLDGQRFPGIVEKFLVDYTKMEH
ncbi:hypothetical protein [Roseibium sediminis]|uniref:hypothetical protein n=1 Tax=Roseibium sediminis TaxID=1775174 RepID=UPI00123CA63B|nr:hypothetical protein [Roseibium sediminis]